MMHLPFKLWLEVKWLPVKQKGKDDMLFFFLFLFFFSFRRFFLFFGGFFGGVGGGGVGGGGLLDFWLTVGIVIKLGVVSPVSTGKKLNGDKRVLSGRHILPVCVIHDVTKLLCLWQNDENCKSNMEDIKYYYFPYVPRSNKFECMLHLTFKKVYVLRW